MKKCFTAKVSSIMKICATQVILALALSGLCIANVNYAQVLETRITVDLRNVTFEQALQKIGDEARVTFSYSHDVMSDEKPVSIQVQDTQLGAVLEELFAPRRITYKVHSKNNLITLSKKTRSADRDESGVRENVPEVLPRYRQARVTGLVTDYLTGAPMPGVNILVKGTTRGTTTDTEGLYGIDAADDDVLVFSFIGYATEERRVGGQIRIDIALMEDIRGLDEVTINAGYYKTTKQQQTGSIVRIEASDLEKQPVLNPLAALQAVVPGMQVIQTTGVPGGNFTVRIRGQNNIGTGNDPLYIINGVPYTSTTISHNATTNSVLSGGTSPLNMLNPADIESIEILKDADATAIYGSRGANGVVLITTKKGAVGKTMVDLSYYTGFARMTRRMDMMNTTQFLEMRKEALKNDGYLPINPAIKPYFADVFIWDSTRYTNWQDELLGNTARSNDGQFSVSGGTDNITFRIGAGYHSETTVFEGDNKDERVSTHFNLSHTSTNKKLKMGVAMNYSVNRSRLINLDMTALAVRLAPNAPRLRNEDGSLYWDEHAWNDSYRNPLANTETDYGNDANSMVGNMSLAYSILPNLEVRSNFGYTNVVADAFNTMPLSFYYPPTRDLWTNYTVFSENRFRNWVLEPQANWQPKKGASEFDILIGMTLLDQTTSGESMTAENFAVEALMTNPRAAGVVRYNQYSFSNYRYGALFGRVNYKFRSRYIVNITGRRDGSTRFGPANRFANFGALGAAWIISEEPFFASLQKTITMLKLRSSLGITGNDQLTDYEYLDTYSPSRSYNGESGFAPVRLSNPDYAWETNQKVEAALDFDLSGRISGSVAYYRNRSSNQLVGDPLPATTGFSVIQNNLPAVVANTGWEVMLNYSIVDRRSFHWSGSVNWTVPRNKLVSFPRLKESAQYSNVMEVGHPLKIKKTFQFEGVDPETGVFRFTDFNGDGILDQSDRQIIKFPGQRHYGGIMNKLSYRNVHLDFLFQFVRQQANAAFTYTTSPGGPYNQSVQFTERWRNPGDLIAMQKYSGVGPAADAFYNYYRSSDQSVIDASFIRLKNVSLSWVFDGNLTRKLHLAQARIYVQGQNLFTITRYDGLDPETQGLTLPPLQVITIGANVTL